MQDYTFAKIDFSISIFKANHVFMEEAEKPVEKLVVGEEELDGIETDSILNWKNLLRAVLID